jgi:hypothetical protein
MRRIKPKGKQPTRTEDAANAYLCAHAEASGHGHAFMVDKYEEDCEKFMKPGNPPIFNRSSK